MCCSWQNNIRNCTLRCCWMLEVQLVSLVSDFNWLTLNVHIFSLNSFNLYWHAKGLAVTLPDSFLSQSPAPFGQGAPVFLKLCPAHTGRSVPWLAESLPTELWTVWHFLVKIVEQGPANRYFYQRLTGEGNYYIIYTYEFDEAWLCRVCCS